MRGPAAAVALLLGGQRLQLSLCIVIFCFIAFLSFSVFDQRNRMEQLEGRFNFWTGHQNVDSTPEKSPYLLATDLDPIKVGVFVVGLGNYINFTHRLVETGRQFFLPNEEPSQSHHALARPIKVTYFLFTNRMAQAPPGDDVRLIHQERLGWPNDSMLRPKMYLEFIPKIENESFDYFYNIDADAYFSGMIGTEILSDLVAVNHWFYFHMPRAEFPFERNNLSCAYVGDDQGVLYYSGAFYGGRRDHVTKLWHFMTDCATQDLSNDIIPDVHDESILNRYLLENIPTEILTPAYYAGEDNYGYWPGNRKVSFVLKDYAVAREPEAGLEKAGAAQ